MLRQENAVRETPVFYDMTGKRLQRALLTCGVMFVIVLAALGWVTLRQMHPLWQARENQSASYPAQLVAQDNGHVPVIGEGVLVRVDLVKRVGRQLYLTDPFTGEVLRGATRAETKTIGKSQSVIEKYKYLPARHIALTFDDGPSQYTPAILDVLERNHVPATFFVIGNNVLKYPDSLKRAVRDGDMIAGHTLTHVDFNIHGSVRNREEVVGTQHIIRDVTGVETRTYRLPYSTEEKNPLGLLVSQQLGLQELSYDLDTMDWQYEEGERNVPTPKLDGLGHVVVMHDGGGDRRATITMLQKLIDEARAKGYTFTTMASLIPPKYYSRATGTTIDDRISAFGLWSVSYGWCAIFNNLMLYATLSTTFLMVLFVVFAAIRNYRFQRRASARGDMSYPVSIILPAYNEEKVLEGTLRNIEVTLANYSAPAEVIVVVNGCTDNTLQMAKAYARHWPQLRVMQSDPGKATALNMGVKAAKYKVVVTIDADTRFQLDTLPYLTRHFLDERVGAVAGHVKVGNVKGLLTLFQKTEYLWGICVDRLALGVLVAPGACTAWWREALLEIGVHGDTKAEDFDTTMRFKSRGAKTRYRVVQDVHAVVWTEAPATLADLWGQRLRWMYGTCQAFWKNRHMLFRWKYGWQGMFLMPYTAFSMLLSFIFLPLMHITILLSCLRGDWRGVLLPVVYAAAVNLVTVFTATRIARESWIHMLVVPIYRFIDAPLRMCVTYVTLLKLLKGRDAKWYSPERQDSVALLPSA